jgi:putative endonuclease
MYFLYILYSRSKDKFYIGQTYDIDKRVAEHRLNANLGATDWELMYTESFLTRSDAMKRELEIKAKKRRTYIEWLISKSK